MGQFHVLRLSFENHERGDRIFHHRCIVSQAGPPGGQRRFMGRAQGIVAEA